MNRDAMTNERMDAKIFKARWQERGGPAAAFLMFLVMLAGSIYLIITPDKNPDAAVGAVIMFSVISALFGALVIWSALAFYASYAVFTFDDEGVTKRLFSRELRILWRDVIDYRISGGSQQNVLIKSRAGETMKIDRSLLYDRQREIVQIVNEKLVGLRERKVQVVGLQDIERKPKIVFGLFLLAFCVGFLVALAYLFGSREMDRAFWAMKAFIFFGTLGMAGLFGYVGLVVMTQRFSFKGGMLHSGNIFGSTTFSINSINAVSTREQASNNTTFRITTVQGPYNKKIVFTSAWPDYELLREFLEKQVKGDKAVERGAELQLDIEKKEARQNIIILPIALTVYFGMGIAVLWSGVTTLWQFHQLDSRGVSVMGSVTRKTHTDKTSVISYKFDLAGQEHGGNSSVRVPDYDALSLGSRVALDYLPDNPAISRIKASNARFTAWFNTILSSIALILSAFVCRRSLPRLLKKIRQKTPAEALNTNGSA